MEEFYDAEEHFSTSLKDLGQRLNPLSRSQPRVSIASSEEDSPSRDESDKGLDGAPGPHSPSKIAKVKHLRQKTKSKAKELLGLKPAEESEPESLTKRKVVEDVKEDPAFNPARALDGGPPDVNSKGPKDLKEAARGVIDSVTHPVASTKEVFKRRAAKEISRAQRPFLSAEDDHELLAAHDELARASLACGANSASGSDEDELEERRRKIERLEGHRDSLRIAWTVGRHVDRVRTINHHDIDFPRKEEFVERDTEGREIRFKWDEYIGHLALYITRGFTAQYLDDFDDLPFDIDTLSRTVERIIVASAPWQTWYMGMRSIYRWENPRRTGFWMVVWIILWQTQHMAGFVYGYIVYIVLKERFYPSSVHQIRSSLDRTLDRTQKANAWGELVDKHGRNDWVEPMLEEIGPYLQLQLSDLAVYLEMLIHFYRWTRPKQTAGSVFFYFSCFLVTVCADMEYCMKIVFFICLGSFFICWPIASRFPKYRFLVDPFKWIYWDIPTDAEASLLDLRKRAVLQQMTVDEEKAKQATSIDGQMDGHDKDAERRRSSRAGTEAFKFRVFSHGVSGRLIITRTDITFSRMRHEAWSITHLQLFEMRKDSAAATSKTKSLGQHSFRITLFYKDKNGQVCERHVDAEEGKRDEIFSIILGWSGLYWKPMRAPTRNKGTKL